MLFKDALEVAYQTPWSRVNAFEIFFAWNYTLLYADQRGGLPGDYRHYSNDAKSGNILGWNPIDNERLSLHLVSFTPPQLSYSALQTYTGGRFASNTGIPNEFSFSATFNDSNQLEFYRLFSTQFREQFYRYFDDYTFNVFLSKDSDYADKYHNDTKGFDRWSDKSVPLMSLKRCRISSISPVLFNNETENQIAQFTVEFVANDIELYDWGARQFYETTYGKDLFGKSLAEKMADLGKTFAQEEPFYLPLNSAESKQNAEVVKKNDQKETSDIKKQQEEEGKKPDDGKTETKPEEIKEPKSYKERLDEIEKIYLTERDKEKLIKLSEELEAMSKDTEISETDNQRVKTYWTAIQGRLSREDFGDQTKDEELQKLVDEALYAGTITPCDAFEKAKAIDPNHNATKELSQHCEEHKAQQIKILNKYDADAQNDWDDYDDLEKLLQKVKDVAVGTPEAEQLKKQLIEKISARIQFMIASDEETVQELHRVDASIRNMKTVDEIEAARTKINKLSAYKRKLEIRTLQTNLDNALKAKGISLGSGNGFFDIY